MALTAKLLRALFGTDRKLRRLLVYWAGTAVLYAVCIALLLVQRHDGMADPRASTVLAWYGAGGTLFFYALVRASPRLGIAPRTLTLLQGLFAITCSMWSYAITGPLRAATLTVLVVVIAFCTFALRPRQTLLLAAAGVAGQGAIMWWLHATDPAGHPRDVEALTFTYMAAALISIAVLTGEMNKLRARLKRQKEELLSAVTTIRTLATVDELTSLANRRHMNEVLSAEERRQCGHGQPTCIAVLDIDFFKQVNDRFGHAAGDEVLRSFAGAARAELRVSDVLARWGGEEFLLMLPNTEQAEAKLVLARMAERVGALQVPGLALGRRITFSGGLAERRTDEPLADTIGRADKALYQAKSAGRDRVITA
jgi:diguanylate cyclase (GGDEF)-like protein